MPSALVRDIIAEIVRFAPSDLTVYQPPDLPATHVLISVEEDDHEVEGLELLAALKALPNGAPCGAFNPVPGSVWHAIISCKVKPPPSAPFARTRLEVLAVLPVNEEDLDRPALATMTEGSLDAAIDALYLVPTGEAACTEHFVGVRGPGGEWSWGREGSSAEDLPPWFDAETCTAGDARAS